MRYVRLLLVAFYLLVTMTAQAQSPFRWTLGEKLVYKVRWSFIRLGTLKMQLADTVRVNGKLTYKILLEMDSNPVLIFVNVHNRYQCLVDSLFRPVEYIVKEKTGNEIQQMIYRFDYEKHQATWIVLDPNDSTRVIKQEQIPLTHTLYDGISLTFFARGHAQEDAKFRVFSFIYDRSGPVDMEFKPSTERYYFKPLHRKFQTYVVEGVFHLKGIAGVTGNYKGWFTHDDRRVPLAAEMKVFVGNVKVELEHWQNWNP